jgi:predicted DsbA family dithiol-disulfide isomerase
MGMQIEVWSDVVCPWCLIGKHRFEAALEKFHEANPEAPTISVTYRAYQLDPRAPAVSGGSAMVGYARKFGGAEAAQRIVDHLASVAAQEGLELRLDRAQRANTLLAHRALWMAEQHPTADQAMLKHLLMQAYFVNGEDVGDPDVVARCAGEAGLDEAEVRRRLDADDGKAEVAEQLDQATELGITGVPTYVFNGQWSVPGAQDTDTFVRVLERLALRT